MFRQLAAALIARYVWVIGDRLPGADEMRADAGRKAIGGVGMANDIISIPAMLGHA